MVYLLYPSIQLYLLFSTSSQSNMKSRMIYVKKEQRHFRYFGFNNVELLRDFNTVICWKVFHVKLLSNMVICVKLYVLHAIHTYLSGLKPQCSIHDSPANTFLTQTFTFGINPSVKQVKPNCHFHKKN